MSSIKLGVQLYTLRNFIKTPEDTDKTFAYLKENGVSTVQISGIGAFPQQQVKEIVEKHGMDVVITHISYDRLKNDTDALIAEHKMINCPNIGIGSMPQEFKGSAEGVKAFIKEIDEIGKKLKAQGMQFGYHNHAFEFERYDGRLVMDMLVEDTNPEIFHFIPDTYWLQVGGVTPAEYLKKLKGRVEVCHFKDMEIFENEQRFTEVGSGNIDLHACSNVCKDIGVQAIVVEEDMCYNFEPLEAAVIGYKGLVRIASECE